MATVDEDGYFFIVDRKKDMIIRGGYNVYPREIEEVLYEHPAVSEVAVIGVPDDALGEEVAAVVVLKTGAEASADEHPRVRQGARRRLQVPAPDLVLRRAARRARRARSSSARSRLPNQSSSNASVARDGLFQSRYAEHLTVRARTFLVIVGLAALLLPGPRRASPGRDGHAVAEGAVGGVPARARGGAGDGDALGGRD